MRHTLQRGLVLRSQDPVGIQQEIWAQLTVYQAIRRAMTDAVESVPGTGPDRGAFSVALETARDQVITAESVLPGLQQPARPDGGYFARRFRAHYGPTASTYRNRFTHTAAPDGLMAHTHTRGDAGPRAD